MPDEPKEPTHFPSPEERAFEDRNRRLRDMLKELELYIQDLRERSRQQTDRSEQDHADLRLRRLDGLFERGADMIGNKDIDPAIVEEFIAQDYRDI